MNYLILKQKKAIMATCLLALLQLSPLQVSAAPSAGDPEQVERMRDFLGLMKDFINIIESVHALAANPEKAAIHQMHEIEEIHKNHKQPELAIELFETILKKTDNQTIRNATYMRLGDLLKKTGQSDKAVRVFEKALMENIQKAR